MIYNRKINMFFLLIILVIVPFLSFAQNDGDLIWHSFQGGDGSDEAYAIETDVAGNVYVVGKGWRSWDMSLAMEAIKLKGRIRPDRQLELPELPPELPEGEVELILLFEREPATEAVQPLSPLCWPVLDGGKYLGGTLGRDEIYDFRPL